MRTIQDNNEFKEFMQDVVLNNKKRKNETSKKYKDIKILTEILLPKDIEDINSIKEKYWLEIQIVLVDNKNESWFSHHWIFDAKKIISRMIRLQWYVSLVYINKVINETKKKNPDIKLSEEQILNHFLETFLLKRREDNSNKNFFITKERYKAFLQSWQVDLNNIHFFDYTKMNGFNILKSFLNYKRKFLIFLITLIWKNYNDWLKLSHEKNYPKKKTNILNL